MRRFAVFLLSLCLAVPALAADAARPERKQVFGEVTVYYNAFASSMLQPQVAEASGLTRSKQLAVLSIAVSKGGKPGMAVLSGTVRDLTGRRLPLSFRAVSSQGAVSYVAQFKVEQAQVMVFDLQVETGGVSHTLQFNQEIFPGE